MRRQYLVEGDVQGVGYRYFVIRLAQQIGVRGWVRNLPNGNVEAIGEGTEAELGKFAAGLRQGPIMASVTKVTSTEILDNAEVLSSFRVR